MRVGRSSSSRCCQQAFTLVEVIVCVAVIGLLLALLLPAVQAVRETSRKSHCAANLKQIGIAIGTYESVHGMFPPGHWNGSLHVRLLPFIDQAALFDKFDFGHGETGGAESVVVPLYFCPSDSASRIRPTGGSTEAATSYAGNCGTGVLKYGFNGMFRALAGDWPPNIKYGPIRTTDIRDGLSNTAAVSEVLHADGTFGRLRVNWNTPKSFYEPSQHDEFVSYCGSVPSTPTDFGWQGNAQMRGLPWTDGNIGCTMYNHMLVPNQPSCFNGSDVQAGIYSAGSEHNSGVNVLYADGHVRFISDVVDSGAWHELGSRIASDLRVN